MILFSLNPSLAALAQALDPRAAGRSLAEIRLLSLGAGLEPKYITGRHVDWGWGQWARPLVSLMVSGVMGVADFQCEQILGPRYHRLDALFDRYADPQYDLWRGGKSKSRLCPTRPAKTR